MQTTWQKIIGSSLILVTLGALFWGFHEHQNVKQQQTNITALKQQYNQLKRKQARTHGELAEAKTEQKKTQAAQNNRSVSPQAQATNKQMNTIITTVFHGLYDYQPDTYGKRGINLKSKLSPKLYQQYFGSKQATYGDGGQITSKLTKINVYQPAVSGSQLKALVVVSYQSKYQANQQWQHGTGVYEVSYEASAQQVSAIKTVVSRNE